ncbi:MAG: SH3 domain-containing protein [Clostridiales bacterium]|nr:SH3 domain-containing protein [Clostridiales bacterium]
MSINVIRKTVAVLIAVGVVFSLTACSDNGDDRPQTQMTSDETSGSSIPIDIPATTTTLHVYQGTLPPNDIAVTWEEEQLESPVTKYVDISSDFLRVRKGPDTEYEQVASLTRNMQVLVVAKTASGWYKLDSGYYVSGDYLSSTPVT